MRKVYLDNAATTPLAPEVVEAMLPYMTEHFGNPSAIHGYGRETRAAIELARKEIAGYLNVSPGEIFFTSGGTEANNTAIRGAVSTLGIKHIISSPIEHHCVLDTCMDVRDKHGVELHYVSLKSNGQVDLEDLESRLKTLEGEKVLVSLMHANNEVGNLLDLEQAGTICKKYNAWFHSDTVQTMAHYPFDLQKLPVDFLSGSAHKFHGPKGIGFLYINGGVQIGPLMTGGSQERNMRSGTENVYGIIGMAKAMEIEYKDHDKNMAYIQSLKDHMIESLKEAVPGIEFNGDYAGNSLYTVLSTSFPANDKSALLMINLDIAGIACSAGSACSSGSDIGSHVMSALGVPEDRTNIRFSFSRFTTRDDVDYAIEKIKEFYPVAVANG